jgi:hypothetical protein
LDPKVVGSLMFSVIAVTVFAVLIISLMINSVMVARTIGSTGSISVIGVDANVTEIDWGILAPGETRYFPVLLTNLGTRPINLNIKTSNWNPANASQFMTVNWTYNNEVLTVNESLSVKIGLHVDPLIYGIYNFTFDITVFAV